jgi:plastocyanin
MVAGGGYGPVIAGMAVGIAFIIIFSFPSSLGFNQNVSIISRRVSIVTILENAVDQGKNFKPASIKVVIGLNNTVRWIDEDSLPYAIVSDTDYIDPHSGSFSTEVRSEDQGGPFVMPGQFFEFTFTKAGEYGYHSVPHPQMRGTIIVLGTGAR